MSKKLDEIEELVNHQPCCDHRNHHYGNCTDCYNTGCAHPPYVEGEAKKDMQDLLAFARAVEDAEKVWRHRGHVRFQNDIHFRTSVLKARRELDAS